MSLIVLRNFRDWVLDFLNYGMSLFLHLITVSDFFYYVNIHTLIEIFSFLDLFPTSLTELSSSPSHRLLYCRLLGGRGQSYAAQGSF